MPSRKRKADEVSQEIGSQTTNTHHEPDHRSLIGEALEEPFDATSDCVRVRDGCVNPSDLIDNKAPMLSSNETDLASTITLTEKPNDGNDEMEFDDDKRYAVDKLAQEWPGIEFIDNDGDYISDPYLQTDGIAAFTKSLKIPGFDAEPGFHLVPGKNKIGDRRVEEKNKGHLKDVGRGSTDQNDGACSEEDDTAVNHCDPGPSVGLDRGKNSRDQAPFHRTPASNPDLTAVHNRVLIREAQQNARVARLCTDLWFLPYGFRPYSNPQATFTIGLTARDFDNDPEIGAGMGAISRDRLRNSFDVTDLPFVEKEHLLAQENYPFIQGEPVFAEEEHLLAPASDVSPSAGANGSENQNILSDANDASHNRVGYTPQDYLAIRRQLLVRLPHLMDLKLCANCGRTPRPSSAIECPQCRLTQYCSGYCQLWDWPMHLFMCDFKANANVDALRDLAISAAQHWRRVLDEIRQARAKGTRLENCPGVRFPVEGDRSHKRNRGIAAAPVDRELMLWSRSLSYHLAKGGRFQMDSFDV